MVIPSSVGLQRISFDSHKLNNFYLPFLLRRLIPNSASTPCLPVKPGRGTGILTDMYRTPVTRTRQASETRARSAGRGGVTLGGVGAELRGRVELLAASSCTTFPPRPSGVRGG